MKTARIFGPRKTFHVWVKDMQWRCLQETPVFDQKTSSIHTVLFVSFFDANILRRQCSHCVFDPHSLAFETPRHIVYFLLCDHDPVGKSIRYILLEIQFLGIWIIIPPPPATKHLSYTNLYGMSVFFGITVCKPVLTEVDLCGKPGS